MFQPETTEAVTGSVVGQRSAARSAEVVDAQLVDEVAAQLVCAISNLISTSRIKKNAIQPQRIKVVEYRSVAEFQRNYQPCHILFISR